MSASSPESVPQTPSTDAVRKSDSSQSVLSRRKFLGGVGGAAAAAMAAGAIGLEPLVNAAAEIEAAPVGIGGSSQRRHRSWEIRKAAADYWKGSAMPDHLTNGDEQLYASRIGNYSKGLPHNSFGEVDPEAYNSLLAAIASSDPDDYDAIQMGPGGAKLTSPQGGLAFDLEGMDSHAIAAPTPPALASKEEAGEMVELYWMSLLRDVNFLDYGSSPLAAAASADLNAFGADFKGPRMGGQVTPQSLFRDVAPGTLNGPYISQFMWMNTPFGVEQIDRKMWTKAPGDHLQSWSNYLGSQNGFAVETPNFAGFRRYIINGRDLSEWVHIDVLFQAYFNACLILGTPPDGSDVGGGIGCPINSTNPYIGNPTQNGFATFGPPHMKALLCEVASRGLKATWHKKWQVHRRLRPENMGARVEVQLNQAPGRYNGALHSSLFSANVLGQVESHNGGTYLLPMAFPEGAPTHPAYTAGHATVAGACVTILKALFDESFIIPNPVVPDATGSTLVPYSGPPLTVGGELNKLASNVATGRNVAGVHWRSDAYASLRIGEQIAMSILRDQKATYNERNVRYQFTSFDGTPVTV